MGGESEPPGHCLHSSGIRETSGQSRPGSGWNFTGDSACSPIPGTLPLRTFPTAPLPQDGSPPTGRGLPSSSSCKRRATRDPLPPSADAPSPVRTRAPACVPAQLVSLDTGPGGLGVMPGVDGGGWQLRRSPNVQRMLIPTSLASWPLGLGLDPRSPWQTGPDPASPPPAPKAWRKPRNPVAHRPVHTLDETQSHPHT